MSALLAPPDGEVRLYDMTAHRVSRGRLPMLDILHQAFVGFLRTSLNKLVNRLPQVSIESVDTVKIADYLAGLPNAGEHRPGARASRSRVRCSSSPRRSSPSSWSIASSAERESPSSATAESTLTPAEERCTQVVLKQIWADLALAWAPIAKLEFELLKHERSSIFVNVGAGADPIIVNRFRVDFDNGGGTFDFAIPQAALGAARRCAGRFALPKPRSARGATGRKRRALISTTRRCTCGS